MVSFSPDGERIVSIAANVAEVWNVDQAKPIPKQTEVAKKSAAAPPTEAASRSGVPPRQ